MACAQKNGAELARDARIIFEKLGPTYVKLGQILSVRPDVLPQAALDELAILQVLPLPLLQRSQPTPSAALYLYSHAAILTRASSE